MQGRIGLIEPEKITVSIDLRMTVKEWRILLDALETVEKKGGTPIWEMRNMINELLSDLEKQCIIKYESKKI